MRLQDVWGDLPEFEQDIIGKDVLFKIQEYRKGQAALELLPLNLYKFYDVHFGSGIGNDEGEFIGLSYHTCGKWLVFGHNQGQVILITMRLMRVLEE